jgi:hypothetical protein
MQALARVNRRFRGKEDGLLVGYAPLTENLQKAIAEYTDADQRDRTLGQDLDRALDELRNEYDILTDILRGFDWRARLPQPTKTAFIDAALKTANYLRDPRTPGNDPEAQLVLDVAETGFQPSRTQMSLDDGGVRLQLLEARKGRLEQRVPDGGREHHHQ